MLVTGLILLVLVSLIALAASRGVRQEAVMANNTRERDLAFQAAEAALREAESRFNQPSELHATFRASTDSATPGTGLLNRKVAAGSLDIESVTKGATADYWIKDYGWFDANGAIDTSKSIAAKQAISGVDQQPRYVVEYLGTGAASGACPGQTHYRYRITALAVGASTAARKLADTRVIVQSEILLCSA